MANDVVKVERPPLPVLDKITGLGPGLAKIRSGMAALRDTNAGLNEDIAAYDAALNMVRDHVRDLHADLQFEVTDKGNGGGGQASSEKIEEKVREIVGTEHVGKVEEVLEAPVAPLPAGPSAGS